MMIYEVILGNHIRILYRCYTYIYDIQYYTIYRCYQSKWCGFIQSNIFNKMNLSQERCCKTVTERGKNNCHEERKNRDTWLNRE